MDPLGKSMKGCVAKIELVLSWNSCDNAVKCVIRIPYGFMTE